MTKDDLTEYHQHTAGVCNLLVCDRERRPFATEAEALADAQGDMGEEE
ncbi:MAG: hypothetical protein ACRDZ4_10850 [Egibacteraceae bacterium]